MASRDFPMLTRPPLRAAGVMAAVCNQTCSENPLSLHLQQIYSESSPNGCGAKSGPAHASRVAALWEYAAQNGRYYGWGAPHPHRRARGNPAAELSGERFRLQNRPSTVVVFVMAGFVPWAFSPRTRSVGIYASPHEEGRRGCAGESPRMTAVSSFPRLMGSSREQKYFPPTALRERGRVRVEAAWGGLATDAFYLVTTAARLSSG